jgi:hypothetical protein
MTQFAGFLTEFTATTQLFSSEMVERLSEPFGYYDKAINLTQKR